MKSIYLKLTLQEPLVISQSNATAGAHQSLDYIPGATLLGALASKHYADLKAQALSYEIFHSGKVRFKNGYPLVNDQPTQPTPMSLHKDKMEQEIPLNYLQKPFKGGVQGKQQRKGYISPIKNNQAWFIFEPTKTLQMRTAIEQNKGTAKESQLYGYQMLQAGTQFLAAIDCDESETADILKSLIKSQTEVFIGRSRSAQYGRVQIDLLESQTNNIQKPIIDIDGKPHLVLWLASDMAVYDSNLGSPVLSPSLQDLGLQIKGEFVSAKSFIRTRQYAPYNGKRRSYDLERQILQQGSILCYQIQSELSDADFAKLQKGLGSYTETGMGQLVLNSEHLELLNQTEINLPEFEFKPNEKEAIEPTTQLMFYLKQAVATKAEKGNVTEQSITLLQTVKDLYQSARNYNGIKTGQAFGPTKTQWGSIRDFASKAKDKADLKAQLFKGSSAFIKKDDAHWDIQTGSGTLMSWLQEAVDNDSIDVIRDLAYKVSEDKTLTKLMEGK